MSEKKRFQIMKWLCVPIFCLAVVFSGSSVAQKGKFILMASTIGPIDAGIVDVLEDQFEKETGIRVRHVGAGTGAALKIAKKGMSIWSWCMRNPSKKNSSGKATAPREFP